MHRLLIHPGRACGPTEQSVSQSPGSRDQFERRYMLRLLHPTSTATGVRLIIIRCKEDKREMQ